MSNTDDGLTDEQRTIILNVKGDEEKEMEGTETTGSECHQDSESHVQIFEHMYAGPPEMAEPLGSAFLVVLLKSWLESHDTQSHDVDEQLISTLQAGLQDLSSEQVIAIIKPWLRSLTDVQLRKFIEELLKAYRAW